MSRKNNPPVATPVHYGLADGSNAHLLVDAAGAAIADLFFVPRGLTVAQFRAAPKYANEVKIADFFVSAINGYCWCKTALKALRELDVIVTGKRAPKIIQSALLAAGELKK